MNERIEKLRDESAEKYYENYIEDFKVGFSVCHDLLMKDVENLIKALESLSYYKPFNEDPWVSIVAKNALTKWRSKYGDGK